jgi:hypothetical protein
MQWERLLKLRVTPSRRFPRCERHSFCCLPCWRVHPHRRRLTTQIHGVQCMAAVGAAHPTAVSGHCNSAWPPSAAREAHASLIDFTIQAAREGAPRQQDRPLRFVLCSWLWWLFQPVLFLQRLTADDARRSTIAIPLYVQKRATILHCVNECSLPMITWSGPLQRFKVNSGATGLRVPHS